MYAMSRYTEGADPIGPLTGDFHARLRRVTVDALIGDEPVGIPLMEMLPQYFGQPGTGCTAGPRGRIGRTRGNCAAPVKSVNIATPKKSRLTIIRNTLCPYE